MTLERALLLQIGALSAVVMLVAAIASAYFSMAAERSRFTDGLNSRLQGYQQVMSDMIEDANYVGAERIADLIAQERDIVGVSVINRFGRTVVERRNRDASAGPWDQVEFDIQSRQGIRLATATYLIRPPTIGSAGQLRIAAIAFGAGALFALFAFAIFRSVRTRFVQPIRALHQSVSGAAAGGFSPKTPPNAPIEIAELSDAFTTAISDLEAAAEQSEKHVDVLTRVLSNFGVAIRYLDAKGGIWDYGHIPSEILPGDEPALRQRSMTAAEQALVALEPPGYAVTRIEPDQRSHDGATAQVEFADDKSTKEVTLFDLGNDEIAVSVADVTRARAIEQSAVDIQKMEIVGQLASGVAHDFNNILGVVLGNAEMLELQVSNPEYRRMLKSITSVCIRGGSLTKSLLSFAGEMSLTDEVFELEEIVKKVISWSARVIPENISIRLIPHEGAWTVRADPGMTENALLNLLLNARDAMPSGGVITIEVCTVRLDEDHQTAANRDMPAGRYTVLRVRDTGIGIPKAHLRDIFEPFYTSKGRGNGSGLGLAMVYGFIRQTGGFVDVSSEENVGTVFDLYFPAFSKDLPSAQVERPDITPSVGTHILLVEDEAPLRIVLQRHLASAGYKVSVAEDGDAAIVFAGAEDPVDLVVTDIVMPGRLSGLDLVRKWRETEPDLPAVFMSGYNSEFATRQHDQSPEGVWIMKPIKQYDLLNAIETALNGRTD